jgi:hypothetical protein
MVLCDSVLGLVFCYFAGIVLVLCIFLERNVECDEVKGIHFLVLLLDN